MGKKRVDSSVVYLIHFHQTYIAQSGQRRKTCQHYCGTSVRIDERLEEHRTGQGNPLMWAVTQIGISWNKVLELPGGHSLERALKNSHNLKWYCPVCNPNYKERLDRLLCRLESHNEQF